MSLAAAPVEFTFRPSSSETNAFPRDIWATLETPDDQRISLPAYYVGDGQWAVRARADQKGNYRFLSVSEERDGLNVALRYELNGRDRLRVRDVDDARGPIRIDPQSGTRFVNGRGQFYQPLGGNLPWADGASPESYYPAAFAEFQAAGLNWTRIWMCHWGQLNLD
ncbi:MAG: DUF5060 domain-containing protein [Candidatus Synoicihabitans palmerolidicus]|nr:DUF5060 domain-containing protein [Candidatus Synoicihabitans palmerolidicus]